MEVGVYSDRDVKDLVSSGAINVGNTSLENLQLQPATFDLRVGGHFYCLPYSGFSPGNEDLESYFKRVAKYDFHIEGDEVGFLHKKNVYVVKLQESLNLPKEIYAKANPKSSIGRIDLHVRLLTENGTSFDQVPSGYKGALWLELYPRSFDIELTKGTSLNQMMFFDIGVSQLKKESLMSLNNEFGLTFDSNGVRCPEDIMSHLILDDVVRMTASIDSGVVGYLARHDAPPVNLNKRDLPASEFFQSVYSKNGSIIVDPDSFYIFSSSEVVNIPPLTCAIMVDVDTDIGEFRGHYAGFFDPGFKSQAVLELRNYGQPFILRDGQIISGLKFFKMKSIPSQLYGGGLNLSSYQSQQKLKLAKYFDMTK